MTEVYRISVPREYVEHARRIAASSPLPLPPEVSEVLDAIPEGARVVIRVFAIRG